MSNFILIPPPNYVTQLLSLAPSFGTSRDYQSLDVKDRVCPGLVFSAFASFMEASLDNPPVLAECCNAIEQFSSSNDSELHNLLVTEVFEAFRQPEISKNVLLPKSRGLYDLWILGV